MRKYKSEPKSSKKGQRLLLFVIIGSIFLMLSCNRVKNKGDITDISVPTDRQHDTVQAGEMYSPPLTGTVCSFMNCDTGRMIRFEQNEYFKLTAVDQGETHFMITDETGNVYYRVLNGALIESDSPQIIEILPAAQQKYRLRTENGEYIRDNDHGSHNTAVLAEDTNGDDISCYWYLTEEGKSQPIRIMPLGDSLTNGVDLSIPASAHTGYREILCSVIAAQDPSFRFVFVGSQRSGGSTKAGSPLLYRHEGHNAYVIRDIYHIDPYYGIFDNVEPWLCKYCPDVILLMIGTNDIMLTCHAFSEDVCQQLVSNWEMLVERLMLAVPQNGAVIAASVPPANISASFTSAVLTFNKQIRDCTAKLAEGQPSLIFTDVFSVITDHMTKESVFSWDGLHFNENGYRMIANQFAEALCTIPKQ
ncbi:MAG: hypothetical protein IJC98_02880 [Clostridia bacterium]|nr:hypothetical protein [Clostridia bacterium]